MAFDLADPRWVTDPGPLLDEVRESSRCTMTEDGVRVLARHGDCLALLRDKRVSSDSTNVDPAQVAPSFDADGRDAATREMIADGRDERPFLFRDPPDHERLRGLVQRAFTPRRIAELRPLVERLSREAVAVHLDGESFDAVAELAWPIPTAVICEMLDIPVADRASFQDQSARLARGLDPDYLLSEDDRRERDEAVMHFALYFNELFAARRAVPGDDLLSALVAAHDGEDRLSEGELLSTAVLLLVAGHETTMNLISGSLLWLARDPAAQARLRERGVDRLAVDELLRVVAPVQLTARALLDEIELDGLTLPKGAFVMTLLAAANRDPRVFDDPTTLRLDRDPNPQLGFGFGLHHCLGAPLARLEAEAVLTEVLARTRSFELTGATSYRPNVVLRGLDQLSLRFVAR